MAAGAGADDGVAGVAGAALGGVHGAGVLQLHLLGHVVGGQHRWCRRPSGSVACRGRPGPLVRLRSALTAVTCQTSRLATNRPRSLRLARSLSRVTTRSPTPARLPSARVDGAGVVDDAGGDELVAGPPGQAGGLLVGVGEQERAHAAGPVGHGRFEGGVFHGRLVAAVDAGAQVVVVQHGGVAVAQAQAGGAFPARR